MTDYEDTLARALMKGSSQPRLKLTTAIAQGSADASGLVVVKLAGDSATTTIKCTQELNNVSAGQALLVLVFGSLIFGIGRL